MNRDSSRHSLYALCLAAAVMAPGCTCSGSTPPKTPVQPILASPAAVTPRPVVATPTRPAARLVTTTTTPASATVATATTTAAKPPTLPPPSEPLPLVHPPGEDFENALGLRMVWIAPGSFLMGSPPEEEHRQIWEGPVHEVTFAEGYWLSALELTQPQYESVTGENPSRTTAPALPVHGLTWNAATRFVVRLTELEREAGRLDAGWRYALPSEARWEYACRAGTTGARYSESELSAVAQYRTTAAPSLLIPGGEREANAWGLHDMLGNVEEWCQDGFFPSYKGAPSDGSARPGSGVRVARGGSYIDRASRIRAAFRKGLPSTFRGPGLRPALVRSDP